MGDVLSLIEKAETVYDEEESRRLGKKLRGKESLDLSDFRDQLRKLRKMGPLGQILEMLPGMGPGVNLQDADETELKRVEAILDSMTLAEQRDHTLLNGSRKRRIARGSGTSVQDVNRLLKQFVQMRKMMKSMAASTRGGKGLRLPFGR